MTMRRPIALVTHEQYPPPGILSRRDLAVPVAGIDIYALRATGLAGCCGLLIGTGCDQRELVERQDKLQAFLDAGNTVVFCGHVAYPFLPGLSEFVPLADFRVNDLRVEKLTRHPVFDGIEPDDLTFRKGVAGFYGRGHNPPPHGAKVLNALGPKRMPVDWLLDYRGGGCLLVHAGNDLWGYGEDDRSAARLPQQLVQWIAARTDQKDIT